MNVWTWLKAALATVGAVLGYLYGPMDALLITLIVCVCVDYATGVIRGAVTRTLDSGIGWKGLLKKVAIFMLVAVGSVVDKLLAINGAVREAVILFYIANEGISILENLGQIGVPFPTFLRKWLVKLKDDKDDNNISKAN